MSILLITIFVIILILIISFIVLTARNSSDNIELKNPGADTEQNLFTIDTLLVGACRRSQAGLPEAATPGSLFLDKNIGTIFEFFWGPCSGIWFVYYRNPGPSYPGYLFCQDVQNDVGDVLLKSEDPGYIYIANTIICNGVLPPVENLAQKLGAKPGNLLQVTDSKLIYELNEDGNSWTLTS